MLDFVILSLAVYRLSVFFIYDDGPFDVFQRLRERVGILYYDNGDVIEESYKGFAGLLSCIYCLSVWWSLLLVLLYWFFPSYVTILSMPFALGGAVMIIERLVHG